MTGEAQPSYEDRAVALIDILGFKNLVASANLERLKELVEIFHSCFDVDSWKSMLTIDAIQFSDTIVVSAKLTNWPDFARFLFRIGFGISNFHLSRFITRGAISYGPYFRQGSILISPALASAYEFESKHARFPRVLLAPDFLVAAKRVISAEPNSAERLLELRSMSVPDLDGFQYLNYLPFYTVDRNYDGGKGGKAFAANSSKLKECLTRHRELIADSLARETDINVKTKYVWLAQYHNFFIESEPLAREIGGSLIFSPEQMIL